MRYNGRSSTTSWLISSAIVVATATLGSLVAHAQPARVAGALGRAYAALAAGRPDEARRLADEVLAQLPRHHGAATLSVAAASQSGGSAGLDAYERWVGASGLEDGFVLEPVALAVLEALAKEKGPVGAEARRFLDTAGSEGSNGAASTSQDASELEGRGLETELAKANGSNKVLLLRGLARTGYRDAAPQVAALLKDPVPEHRAAAAEALGLLGAVKAVPQVQALLKDPSGEVRAAAAIALHRLGDGAGDALLSELLASGIPDVQLQAAEAMAGDPAPAWAPYIEPLLGSDAPMTRLSAARLLLPVTPDRARAVLADLLNDANPVVVGEMAKALAEENLGDLATIRRLLRHPSPEGRLYGAVALLRLTGGLPGASVLP